MVDEVEFAVVRERLEQFNLRLNAFGQVFFVFSAILTILAALLGWGIFGLYGRVGDNKVEIVSLRTLATERFTFQASLIDDLKAQVAALNEALGESPARISEAAQAAAGASDTLAQRISAIEALVLRIEDTMERLDVQPLKEPPRKQ
jgi:hypothetical protein